MKLSVRRRHLAAPLGAGTGNLARMAAEERDVRRLPAYSVEKLLFRFEVIVHLN